MQSGGARDRERFLHQHFGAAVAAEPRLADSLFEVEVRPNVGRHVRQAVFATLPPPSEPDVIPPIRSAVQDRKSTRLNSSHSQISYAVFCLKKKKKTTK